MEFDLCPAITSPPAALVHGLYPARPGSFVPARSDPPATPAARASGRPMNRPVWLTPAQSTRQAAAWLYSRRTPPSRSRRSTRPVGSGITSASSQGRRCSIPWCGRAWLEW